MEETIPTKKENKNYLFFLVVAMIVLGLAAGWYFGKTSGYNLGYEAGYNQGTEEGIEEGKKQGRDELLAEQEQTVQEVINELRAAANPYEETEEINPFSEGYENPFSE